MKLANMFNITTLTFISLLSACGGNQETKMPITNNTTENTADVAITNATVYTLDKQKPWAQAIAIKDDKIIFVGTSSDALAFTDEQTELIDAKKQLVLPGLHDVHMHPLESASEATHFTLPEFASESEYQDAIHQAALNNPDAKWLIGYGPSLASMQEFTKSPVDVIDEVLFERPVIIMEQTSHSMWVNSKALERAGINHYSQDPQGGVIGRNSQGELDGILYDNAGNIVMDLAMQAIANEQEENYHGFVNYTQPELLAHGITSISDARVYWQRGQLDTWQKLSQNNALKLRVSLGLWAYPDANDESQIKALTSMFDQDAQSLLKVNQIKFYMDGILVNTTAAMKSPYLDSWLTLPDDKGLNYFTQARLEKYIKALEPIGFDFNIHGIGDRGIHEALNAIENASSGSARHRITHVEVIDQLDIARFNALGVIADAQVAGEFSQPSHWHEMEPLLGRHRADNLVPIKSLVDQKAMLTLSSDWNVSSFNPFIGIANAISRAPQAISIHEAIKAYTLNAAFALRQDEMVGSIEVGKQADLIMIDRNILTLDADAIAEAQVDMTMINGEILYVNE